MKFEELSKKHQEFLMYCLSDYIKGKIRKGSMDGMIFPSYEQYKAFFDEFDGEYEKLMGFQSQKPVQVRGPNLPSHKGTGYHPNFVENLLMS